MDIKLGVKMYHHDNYKPVELSTKEKVQEVMNALITKIDMQS